MIVDGKKIAEDIVAKLARERDALPPVLCLGVLMSEGDAASDSFVRIKERLAQRLRVVVLREVLSPNDTTAQALRALERLAAKTAGIIVQLPLPSSIDAEQVLRAIPPEQDIDFVRPPVAEAVREILTRTEVKPREKKAVVVGAGKLVGVPAAALLRELGAAVSVVTESRGSLAELKDADIVILGAGNPGFIKPAMLKQGVVLLDAGASEQGGRVAGDADPACAAVASVFTPVPGGVGPIAVAMLFKNLFALVKNK